MVQATIVLNKTECLDELLSKLSDSGIRGATIHESTGMAHSLDGDIKFMTSLRLILDPQRESSKTIFMIIDEEQIQVVSKVVNQVTGGLNQPDTGILFCCPISYVEGLGE